MQTSIGLAVPSMVSKAITHGPGAASSPMLYQNTLGCLMSMTKRAAVVLLLALACVACSEAPRSSAEAPPPAPIADDAAARLDAALAAISPAVTMEQWGRSCAFCHASGNAGAPRLNDVDAWRDRVAAGEAQLLQHTLEGLNAMPPLGYCMDCTEADFRALIRFMIPAELKTTETDT